MATASVTQFIHEHWREELERRVRKVNVRATRLGVDQLTLEFTGKTERRFREYRMGVPIYNTFIEATIHGAQPKLPGGWVLLAIVDHREKHPIVSTIPGQEMPPGQRDRGGICDHCGKVRRRADTFVLQAEDGRVVQVGRQCLADFLGSPGTNPEALMVFWVKSFGCLDDEMYMPMGGREPDRLGVSEVVLLAGAVVNVNGWVSRAKAEDLGQIPTSSRIFDILRPPKFTGRDAAERAVKYREWVASVKDQITPELEAERDAAIAWTLDQANKPKASEFMLDLKACIESETIAMKYVGHVAYIMAGYRRAQERLIEAERKRALWADSKHVGELKQRLEADLEMIDMRVLPDNGWGETYLYTFKDGEGNCIKWFASDLWQGWTEGQTRHVKMTIKKHDEWNEVKQTVVNRVAEFTPKVKCTMS